MSKNKPTLHETFRAMKKEKKKEGQLPKLIRLFRELDCELDGVKLPFTASAIANAIRHTLNEMEE